MFNFQRLRRWLLSIDERSTPLELAERPVLWQRVFQVEACPPKTEIRPYKREIINESSVFYSARGTADTLIICFCGIRFKLFLELAVMLQNIDHTRFDLLALADFQRLHFDEGVEAGSSWLAMMEFLQNFAAQRGYRHILTYGASMGGIASLRAGNLLKADRSISDGGRFPWHIGRLVGERQRSINAFDAFCSCRMPARSPALLIYSAGVDPDVEGAMRANAIDSQARRVPMPFTKHNFVFPIYKAGGLPRYYELIFDISKNPKPGELQALLKDSGEISTATNAVAGQHTDSVTRPEAD